MPPAPGQRFGPTVFRWGYSDRRLVLVGSAGRPCRSDRAGVPTRPRGVGLVVWLVVWRLYLSIVNVGQRFYAFGWESLLLEAGFLAAFLGGGRRPRRSPSCGSSAGWCSGSSGARA